MNAETKIPELLEAKGYTKQEIRWRIAQLRSERLPDRTLNHWFAELSKNGVCLTPNCFGLYEDEDLKVLARLAFWLKRKQKISQFANIIKQEYQNAS